MPIGYLRGSAESLEGGCSCLVIAFVLGAIAVAALIGFGIYATNVAERGW